MDGGSGWPVVVQAPPWPQAGVMDTTTSVRVRGLRKSYGDTVAVDGVDLDIRHGEVFALLGPNGAGKTTTLEILEGFRAPTGAARRRALPAAGSGSGRASRRRPRGRPG